MLGKSLSVIARENRGANEIAALNQILHGARSKSGIETCKPVPVHFTQHAAIAKIKSSAGIAKGSTGR